MSAFEFFFSLYGLVLGLSVVEIVSGFARLAHDRRGVKIGWLTPMLALVMLLDLANFWVSAYRNFQGYELSYAVMVIALGVASLYYVAASVVFPRDFEREPDFDAVYLRHRRLVMGILAAVGVIAFELIPMLTAEGGATRLAVWSNIGRAWEPLLFYAAFAMIIGTRNRWVNGTALAVIIGVYLSQFVRTLPT